MKEINKGELYDAVDLSIPQIVREPIIRWVDKNWGRFLAEFSGNEATVHKRLFSIPALIPDWLIRKSTSKTDILERINKCRPFEVLL